MTATPPTFSQIKAQVAAIRQKSDATDPIGIRTQGQWTEAARQEDGEQVYVIYQCDSPMAVRLALGDRLEDGAIKVLMTPLAEQDLEADILLRLARRQLFAIHSWQIVKTLFAANTVDPRLLDRPWIADMLLDLLPADAYTPVTGGFLDAERVWQLLLGQAIGLEATRPDLPAILAWTADRDRVRQYQTAPAEFQVAAAAWLAEIAGEAARLILDCVAMSDRPEALPLGLAAAAIFHPQVGTQLDKAIGKIEERFLRGTSPPTTLMRQWSEAAVKVFSLFPSLRSQQSHLVRRSDELLNEMGAIAFAHLSPISEEGFQQRLAHFGRCLLDLLTSPTPGTLQAVEAASRDVCDHQQAGLPSQQQRLMRVNMAVRLSRWWLHVSQNPVSPPSDLAMAVRHQGLEGGFVDWARWTLRSGDPVSELSAAYQQLFQRVTAIREQANRHFATLLRDWVAVAAEFLGDRPPLLTVDAVLTEIVAPLAEAIPVLVIVMDGMSVAVCRELLADLTDSEWVALAPTDTDTAIQTGLAAIPSITEVSRASLLSGKCISGTANVEQKEFAAHPALVKACRSDRPPLLFHKKSLQDGEDPGLAQDLRDAINDVRNRVVGVIVNAIDDSLAKSEQIDLHWSRKTVKLLPALLHEAKASDRLVLLLSDHGHVLDANMEYRPAEGGERWRNPENDNTNPPSNKELSLQGQRVVTPSQSLIVPWSETLRYAPKKNGYHGGLSLSEMVVPIVVLRVSGSADPKGWREALPDMPLWWEDSLSVLEALAPTTNPTPENHLSHLGPLFELLPPEAVPAEPAQSQPVIQWIADFLASPIYQAQRSLVGRQAPNEDTVTAILTVFQASDRAKLVTLARAIHAPLSQLQQTLPLMQRILNIDGNAILTFEPDRETLRLNKNLLERHFDIST